MYVSCYHCKFSKRVGYYCFWCKKLKILMPVNVDELCNKSKPRPNSEYVLGGYKSDE